MNLGELQMAKTVTMRMRREAIFWSLFCLSVCFALIWLDSWKENGRSLRTFLGGWERQKLHSAIPLQWKWFHTVWKGEKKDIHDFMLLLTDLARKYYTYIILLQQAQSYE